MASVDDYIIMTLIIAALTFCFMFTWLCLINKTLDLIRKDIDKMGDTLWHMKRQLSVQDVDAERSLANGSLRRSILKSPQLPTECVKTALDGSIPKTPSG